MVTWEENKRQYGTGRIAMLGHWEIGWAGYDGMAPKGSKNVYGSTVHLPGMKLRQRNTKTQHEAEQRVEKAVEVWVRRAGLRSKEKRHGKKTDEA